MKSRSKIHRTVKVPRDRSIFSLTLGEEKLTDRTITEISITRGQSGYSYGVQPATMTFGTPGLYTSRNNAHVELSLTPWAAQHIANLTSMPAEAIQARFYGRVGLQDSEDNGDGRNSFTTFSASSYSSLLRPTTRTYTVHNRTTIINVIRSILEHPRMANRLKTFPGSYAAGQWDETYIEGTEEKTFSQIISDYADKQLIFICERRDGQMHVQSLALREAYLKDRASSRYAPLRSHTLAPATWKQTVEARSSHLYILERRPTGIIRREWASGTAVQTQNDYPVEIEEIDMTHIMRLTDNNDRVMTALNYQKNFPRATLGKVKFNITKMLAAKDWYTRRMAGELLRLEHGDAVYFSGDWQAPIRTAMIAQQIRESITPDRWEMEIELLHPSAVLGIHEIPAHPPKIWDQLALERWDEETMTWEEY